MKLLGAFEAHYLTAAIEDPFNKKIEPFMRAIKNSVACGKYKAEFHNGYYEITEEIKLRLLQLGYTIETNELNGRMIVKW